MLKWAMCITTISHIGVCVFSTPEGVREECTEGNISDRIVRGASMLQSISANRKKPTMLQTKEAFENSNTMYIAGVLVHNLNHASPSATESWIVKLPDDFTDEQLHSICREIDCTLEGHPSEHGVSFVTFTGTLGALNRTLLAHPEVEFAQRDELVYAIPEIPSRNYFDGPDTSQDMMSTSSGAVPWGLDRIDDATGLDGSYDGSVDPQPQGAGVHVYVLDTGIRTTHQDFGGRATPAIDYASSGFGTWVCEGPSDINCARDNQGHGTHSAATIIGTSYGVAKGARAYAVKVLNDQGEGLQSWIVGGIDWAVANARRPAVISMSLGGPRTASTLYEHAINRATTAGVTVVVAAGNEAADACTKSPAYIPNAVTVGSSTRLDESSGFSNYGNCIDIFAPGSDIRSAGVSSDQAEEDLSGTSMACPHVSGAAALLLSRVPGLSAEEVASTLVQNAGSDLLAGADGIVCPVGSVLLEWGGSLFRAGHANFGTQVLDSRAYSARTLVLASPEDGCVALNPTRMLFKIVLIRRGTCAFTTKAKNAQNAGAAAAIIYNNAWDEFGLGGEDSSISIPTFSINGTLGNQLRDTLRSAGNLTISLRANCVASPNKLLRVRFPPTTSPTLAPSNSPTLAPPTVEPTPIPPTVEPTPSPTTLAPKSSPRASVTSVPDSSVKLF